MYRRYNPNSGEHFYTASADEAASLVKVGWRDEGIAWVAPTSSTTPVYRLYSGTDHHYTTSRTEKNELIRLGWKFEGVGWYSDDAKTVALLRQFNPNVNPQAKTNNSGSHNYTTSDKERDALVAKGWRDEGVGWYALAGADDAKGKALQLAEEYIASQGISYDQLIENLVTSAKFTSDVAKWAADNCGANWNEQAVRQAKYQLEQPQGLSRTGMLDVLQEEDFTAEQAEYAADRCGADWTEQAKKQAAWRLKATSAKHYSYDNLVNTLTNEDGFTAEQAKAGADSVKSQLK